MLGSTLGHEFRCSSRQDPTGFIVVAKDGSLGDGKHYKANVDVLMAIDAVELCVEMRPDVVVPVTGDADFAHLALRLGRRGIREEVAATAQTLGTGLKAAANEVIDLVSLFETFELMTPAEWASVSGNSYRFSMDTIQFDKALAHGLAGSHWA